jgi:pimeloyl-ACP methyl ester carboxylesterase
MKRHPRHASFLISPRVIRPIVIILLCLCALSCAEEAPEDVKDYTILHRTILQPVDHSNPDGPKLKQCIDILIPEGAPLDSPVFFNLGNETDATDEHLRQFHQRHGRRKDIIYIQAEHRGYGQSLTAAEEQSVPSYIRIEQVLADTHEVVTQLKQEYPGPWMAAGWSYGGGLVIEYAYRYPEDVAVVLSSSGVVDWPFLDYGYDRQVQETLGEACYNRLAKHAANLKQEKPFDQNWLDREFLYATAQGVVQYPNLKRLQPFFKVLTFLPTTTLIRVLHRMDDKFGDGEAWKYARATGATSIGSAEIEEGLHNWHAWRYQMCAEIGGFLASETPDGLFTRTRDDFCEECRIQFGEEPPAATDPEWSQREMVAHLQVPLVYVAGGMDPWHSVCLEPDYQIKNGKYFFVPDGQHCPERADPELARQVLDEMLKYATMDR